jgi:glycosyltransferase involved in cell wall biosynthesis
MSENMSLSVVMPALNEEENISSAIEDTLTAFDGLDIATELIVVNDGSTDGTRAIIERFIAADPRVSAVHHDHPLGIGRSFWDGKTVAKHDLVVMYPGDNEMIATEMLRYLPLMQHTDVVIPYIVNNSVRSTLRRVLSAIYTSMITTLLHINVHHTNGLVMYRKTVLNEVTLVADDFLYQTEILAKIIRNGYLYAEVPYYIKPRLAGVSKTSTYGSITGLVRLAARLSRLTWEVYTTRRREIIPTSATFTRQDQLLKAGMSV